MQFGFSLKSLFATVAFVALGCVAMVYVTPLWATITYSLAVLVLLIATVAFCTGRKETKAFWAGFIVFGWAHFFLVFGPWFSTEHHLVTHDVVRLVHGYLDPARAAQSADPGFNVVALNEGSTLQTGPNKVWHIYRGGTYDRSMRIGHSLFTVFLATLGGLIGKYFSTASSNS